MTTTGTKLTYQEYLDEPYTLTRFDIVDGEVTMSADPNIHHQRTSRRTFRPIDSYVAERGIGEVLYAPVDVIIQTEPLRVRQPDLLFIGNDRAEIIQDDRIHGAPDLVVEILSQSNSRADIESKLADYARIGVRECWLAAPQGRTVEVLELDAAEWRRLSIRGVGEVVETMVLEGLELAVSDIFQGV
jgi:Uma2 family endonuclease